VDSSDLPQPSEPTPSPASPPAQWHEQDGVLRDMWMSNKTPQEISDALNRSIPAIMTRAARLGLPRRSAPGRKPGRRGADGAPLGALPRSSSSSSARVSVHTQQATAVQTSLRVCLMCLSKFESVGRQNRICASCKGSAEYESASSLPELHVPSS